MKRFVPSSTYWAGAMRTRKSLVLPAGGLIAVSAVVGLTVAQPRAGEAAQNRAQIDLVIQIRCPDGKCRTSLEDLSKPESTEGRPWGQPLKKPAGALLNLG